MGRGRVVVVGTHSVFGRGENREGEKGDREREEAGRHQVIAAKV